MQIGIIGLGKMGFNLALNLKRNKYDVVAQDINNEFVSKIGSEGIDADNVLGSKIPICCSFFSL